MATRTEDSATEAWGAISHIPWRLGHRKQFVTCHWLSGTQHSRRHKIAYSGRHQRRWRSLAPHRRHHWRDTQSQTTRQHAAHSMMRGIIFRPHTHRDRRPDPRVHRDALAPISDEVEHRWRLSDALRRRRARGQCSETSILQGVCEVNWTPFCEVKMGSHMNMQNLSHDHDAMLSSKTLQICLMAMLWNIQTPGYEYLRKSKSHNSTLHHKHDPLEQKDRRLVW